MAAQCIGHEANGGRSLSVDLDQWPLWVELESEPMIFNVMLTEMGVRGVRTQEVIDFDDIGFLPQPVHALIFLYKYKASLREDRDRNIASEVWFARQTAQNACATYALLNIVNNIPGIQLGAQLQKFKISTADLTPLEKGYEVDQLHFVRAIHNSFATDNELIAADQSAREGIEAARKRKAAAAAKKVREERAAAKKLLKASVLPATASRASGRLNTRKSTHMSGAENAATFTAKRLKRSNGDKVGRSSRRAARFSYSTEEEEAAFHFCAYMPINGRVFKLDGLEPTPEDIGTASESWLQLAVPAIQAWIAQYEGQIEFNLMAVVEDTDWTGRQTHDPTAVYVNAIERKLDSVVEDWRELLESHGEEDAIPCEPTRSPNLTPSQQEKLYLANDLSTLLDLRRDALQEQTVASVTAEREVTEDEGKALHRRFDYASFVREWMSELADADVLATLTNNQ